MMARFALGLAITAGIAAFGIGQVSDAHHEPSETTTVQTATVLLDQPIPTHSLAFVPPTDTTSVVDPIGVLIPEQAALPKAPDIRAVEVSRGDTLMGILTKNGVDRKEAHAAVTELGTVFDVRRLQIGQAIDLAFETAGGEDKFVGMSFQPDPERDIAVTFEEALAAEDAAGKFVAVETTRELTAKDSYAAATIDSSLYEAAIDAGMPIDALMKLIRVFSFDVDFQRDVQPGDRFELLYESMEDETGNRVRTGEVHYASMTLSGKSLSFYKFTPSSGITDYFDATGRSVRKTLMRTPVDGARLSSRFGNRKHPILGYNKMHRGVDFAAPRGTPIMAAGDGVVEVAGRKGGYGNYLRLRHTSELKTAYAHIYKFARGIRKGTRVSQGDIIAYVGSTGRSTGPHLHYEVLIGGKQVNPLSVKLPAGEKLKGDDIKKIQAIARDIDVRIAKLRAGTSIASAP